MFDEFWGVQTHPLAVHAPVVLVPVATIAAIVLAVRADWRQRINWRWPAVVFVLVVLLFVAKESGEAAKEADNIFGDIGEHEELANTTFVMSIVWFVLTVGVALRDRMTATADVRTLSADAAPAERDPVALALAVLCAVAAVLTTVWLIRAGHAGAESRWNLG